MKAKLKQRKGVLGGLQNLGLGIVILVVLVSVGSLIVNEVDEQANDSNVTSITDDGQDALLDLTGWLGIIVVASVGALVIALIVAGFNRFGGSRGGF